MPAFCRQKHPHRHIPMGLMESNRAKHHDKKKPPPDGGGMALLAVVYGIGGTDVLGRTLGDFIAIGQHNAVLMESLAIQHRALIVRPGTQIVRSGGQHAAFIAPSGVGANEGAAVDLKGAVTGVIQHSRNIILHSNSNKVSSSKFSSYLYRFKTASKCFFIPSTTVGGETMVT